MVHQLSIFDPVVPNFKEETFDYHKGEFKEESKYKTTPECDKIMEQLDLLNQLAKKQNDLLKSMIDDLQKDWSEEEKLMVNNPEEYRRLEKLKKQENKIPEQMPELSTQAIDTLKNSLVDGLVVRLPEGQLDRKIYLEVKSKLELIGGKWKGGKISGFVFPADPSELLEQIANGANRNLKKEFQFFATPSKLADKLVELANIHNYDRILEPEAGQGAIIDAIHRVEPDVVVDCCEIFDINQTLLREKSNIHLICDDFMQLDNEDIYDKIIANPPFSKNQDIDHITKMWHHLKPGGTLVAISSKHWQISSNKKETEFKQWLQYVGAEIIEIANGEFKESGTEVGGLIIVVDKKLNR